MRSNLPIKSTTEFVAKSLVAAGVILSIPLGLSAVVAATLLWKTWPHGIGVWLGWLTFCAIGFSLLALAIRVVRSPDRVHRPRAIWIGAAAYLAVILTGAAIWLIQAQDEITKHEGPAMTADFLGIAALLLIIPLWAFVLSVILCFRPTESSVSATPFAPLDESI